MLLKGLDVRSEAKRFISASNLNEPTPPKGFSSITFDRDKILKRNFG